MTVNTIQGSWVVPSKRAVWVPAGIYHEIEMTGAVSMRSLYFRPELSGKLPNQCRVMEVSALMRELILYTIEIGMLDRTNSSHRHLIGVIVDQLNTVQAAPLTLSMPSDLRALRIANGLREQPGDPTSLARLSKHAGASKRTVERIFQAETGMTFGKWRQQLRLLYALKLLASGESVTTTALEVGYDGASAFIAAFKSVLGTTPARYFAESSDATKSTAATLKPKPRFTDRQD